MLSVNGYQLFDFYKKSPILSRGFTFTEINECQLVKVFPIGEAAMADRFR